jgi:outer membrane protein
MNLRYKARPIFASLTFATFTTLALQPFTLQAAEAELQVLPAFAAQDASVPNAPPLNLLQIYQQAQANDPAWAAAQKGNQAAQEKVIQGRALMLPTVGLSANANHSDANINYTGSSNVFRNNGSEHFDTYGYTLNASQPVYRPQNSIQYDQSKIQAAYADVQLTSAQQDLTMRVSQAYFDVLIAQDKIELINAQKLAITQQLNLAQANFKVGVATITDVNDAKAKLDLLLAQEIAAYNSLEDKKRAIESITGTSPDLLVAAQRNLNVDMIVPREMNAWVELAIQNNPELQAQQKTLEYTKQEVARNHAGHMPTLDMVGNYNYTNANGGINGFGNELNNLTLGLQLQLPLYQGGAISSKEREAALNYQKAQDELEQSRRKAILQTRQAWLNLSSAIAQVHAYEQAVLSGQSQVDSTKKAYKVGLRNTVDVLNAEQQFYTAQHDLHEARYTYLTNIIKLKTAAGVVTEQDVHLINAELRE